MVDHNNQQASTIEVAQVIRPDRIPNIRKGIANLHARARPAFFPIRSDTLADREIEIYARVGQRVTHEGMGQFVTIATIDVMPDYLRRGLMREVFEFAEAYVEANDDLTGVYVECVNNPEAIAGFLLGRGYVLRPDTGFEAMGLGDYYRVIRPVADPSRS